MIACSKHGGHKPGTRKKKTLPSAADGFLLPGILAQDVALGFCHCVTLDKRLTLSGPQHSHV